jgi:hypothetical protein
MLPAETRSESWPKLVQEQDPERHHDHRRRERDGIPRSALLATDSRRKPAMSEGAVGEIPTRIVAIAMARHFLRALRPSPELGAAE